MLVSQGDRPMQLAIICFIMCSYGNVQLFTRYWLLSQAVGGGQGGHWTLTTLVDVSIYL